MADSNSFLSPYKILPIAQLKKYMDIFGDFFRKAEGHCFWLSVVRGAWGVARGAWRVVRGAWRMVRGAWFRIF